MTLDIQEQYDLHCRLQDAIYAARRHGFGMTFDQTRELVAFAAALNDLFDWPGPIAPLWGTRVQQYAQATGLFNRVVDELLEGGMHWLRYQRWHELTSLVERLEACIQEAKARYLTVRAEVAHAPA